MYCHLLSTFLSSAGKSAGYRVQAYLFVFSFLRSYFSVVALLTALTSSFAYLVMWDVQNYSGFVALDIGFLQHLCWGIHKSALRNRHKMSAYLSVIPLSLKPWHFQFCETHEFFYVFILKKLSSFSYCSCLQHWSNATMPSWSEDKVLDNLLNIHSSHQSFIQNINITLKLKSKSLVRHRVSVCSWHSDLLC